LCQACSIIPKKTQCCNRCQRCFNKVLSKGSEYLCKCDISVFYFNTFSYMSKKNVFCFVIMGHCDVIMGHCDVIMGHCDVVMGHCDVIMGHCDVIMGHCDVIMGHCV
jgi:hypothetical protein